MDERTDPELIRLCRERDDDAFLALLERYTPMLRKAITDFGMDYGETVGEAQAAFHNAVLRFADDRGVSFGAFAKVCVRNALLDVQRRSAPVPDYTDVAHVAVAPGIESGLIRKEERDAIRRIAEENLSPFEREVFAKMQAGEKTASIAASLGVPPKSVDNAKTRIRAKIGDRLRERLKN